MICKELKILHINICRNACSSIGNAFNKAFPKYEFINKHHSISNICKPIPNEVLKTYKSFSVVRNPFDRMISIWLWGYKKWKVSTLKDFLVNFINGKYKRPAERYSKVSGLSYNWMYYPQISWITDTTGAIRVDKILRFENLDSDFSQLCRDWNLPVFKLPKINTAKSRCGFERKHWKHYYDNESLDMVRDFFKEDFKVFNYATNKYFKRQVIKV